jgi:putative nucleotidyltransferase with HDIG domain
MRRILFVDDEPRILDALRRMLRPYREEWDMHFAAGGAAALQRLATLPVDVVVSDMRMPGMDGAALLEEVATRSPATIRVVPSGQTDAEAAARAVPVAHQFLMKPCEPAVVREVIERACALRDLLQSPVLREVVGAVESLPPALDVYRRLGRALADPQSSIEDIAGVIEQDAALTAKVLQLVNSSFFGLRREVSSVSHATALLGTGLIRSLVLVHHVFGSGAWGAAAGLSLEQEQAHAIQVAGLVHAMLPDRVLGEAAVTAGLLHDIGKLILACRLPGAFERDLLRGAREGVPLHLIEAGRLGVSHAEVGAALLGLWGLPHPVVEAVAHHHRPDRVVGGERRVLAAVHVADCLVHEAGGRTENAGPPDPVCVAALGGADRLESWRVLAAEGAAI